MKIAIQISMDLFDAGVKEVEHLLRSYAIPYKIISILERFVILEVYNSQFKSNYLVWINMLRKILERTACVKRAIDIYDTFEDVYNRDLLYIAELDKRLYLFKKYAIHVHLFNPEVISKDDIPSIIEDLYRIYLSDKDIKIDLKEPDIVIGLYNIKNKILIGLEFFESVRKGFEYRRAKYRPVFSPFSLNPKIARLMINLSGVKEGELLIDPFCGVGSIPIESSLMSIESICIEYFYRWSLGAFRNVKWIDDKMRFVNVINADSLLDFIRSDCPFYVVTDPPYGRITSTGTWDQKTLYLAFIKKYVSSSIRSVFMSPKHIDDFIYKYSLNIIFKTVIPVHRKLSRILYVVERG